MTDSAPKQEPPYGLRMPPDLKARVKAAAEANNRSMNAEIVATLEEKYPAPNLASALTAMTVETVQQLSEMSSEERAKFMEGLRAQLSKIPDPMDRKILAVMFVSANAMIEDPDSDDSVFADMVKQRAFDLASPSED
ncbi:Arc family DNA-binding protein [Paracoccus yeei]|uniref:Arc family DNA-binding protein n=1 Tax=Paracoccus yeei TaxID=147645 RepID=A0A1V0GVN3_9RHOB|nr:Arc family DNA-binding protein [Paracoccus yeei]ARC37878.1 Arc family DNA-binding protein [Paracoccus yeei]